LDIFSRSSSVAQIFNLLYRKLAACWPHDLQCSGDSAAIAVRTPADYKSAMQQIEHLRYAAGKIEKSHMPPNGWLENPAKVKLRRHPLSNHPFAQQGSTKIVTKGSECLIELGNNPSSASGPG
jgi:hypothetical protein